jgi:hypothetical protein
LEGATTIFAGMAFPFIGRMQKSKNCYIHAAAQETGYKIAYSRTDNNYKAVSVDVAKHVRHVFSDVHLEDRVVRNKGGSSFSLLKLLLSGSQPPATLCSYSLRNQHDINGFVNNMNSHGPILICRFIVDSSFRNGSKEQDSGKSSSDVRIHQFDRLNGADSGEGIDSHKFFSVGTETAEERQIINTIKQANGPPAEPGSPGSRGIAAASSAFDTTARMPLASSASTPASAAFSNDNDDDDDDDEETKNGLHAMVAIGYRVEETGDNNKKYWFLLQNTWKKMPLLEVSGNYLIHKLKNLGHFVAIEGDLATAPRAIDTCDGLFWESAFDDGGEEEEEVVDDSDVEE